MIENIRKRVEVGDYRISIHAFERCIERSISPEEIEDVILSGEVIEDYMKDKYGPSCLIYGITEAKNRRRRSEIRGQKSEVRGQVRETSKSVLKC